MSTLQGKDVTKISGPAIVGGILNWYLYGVLTVQYILYLLYSRNDKLVMKIIVHFLFALETVQTILSIDDTFFYFVYGFGNVERLFEFHWAFDIPTFDAMIGLIVQGVYCWRIWVLSRWKIVPLFSFLVSLMAGISGIIAGILFKVRPDLGKLPAILWLIGSAVADIIITGSMTHILTTRKRGAPAVGSPANNRVFRLLVLILETNTITAAVSIIAAVMFFIPAMAPPASNFYQFGPFILGKLYSNCFMVLLNQRYHSSESRSGTTASNSYQHGSRADTQGFSIELRPQHGAKTSNISSTSYHSPRTVQPPLPKAPGLDDDF